MIRITSTLFYDHYSVSSNRAVYRIHSSECDGDVPPEEWDTLLVYPGPLGDRYAADIYYDYANELGRLSIVDLVRAVQYIADKLTREDAVSWGMEQGARSREQGAPGSELPASSSLLPAQSSALHAPSSALTSIRRRDP